MGNYYRPPAIPRKFGATHRSWMTSAPSWFLKAVGEGMFGVRATYQGIAFDPCLPRKWKRAFIRRRIRGAIYEVEIRNPDLAGRGVREVRLDGRPVRGNLVPFQPAGGTYRVEVVLGRK
jgi:cellobiose phosphorylase